MLCWDCQYFDYDEIYDSETGEEWQLPSCLKGNDCDDISDYKECNDYME